MDEVKVSLQGMSEDEQKSYLFEVSDGSICPLCDKSFTKLKTHLGSCMRKHLALDATNDSTDTRSKDRNGTETQWEMSEETDNAEEDKAGQAEVFIDSKNEVREGTQSHTKEKQLESVICNLKHLTQEERINFLLSCSVGGEKCPLCLDVFSDLKTHLDLCLQKHVGIPSVETIKEKLPADSESKKDVNELKKVLQGMSEEEQKSYLYEKGNGSRCTLCDKSFKRLKTHLGSCIQKHFALDATDDSADTRSKDRGGTERQQEMLEETNNTKEDSEVETGAITDSQIGVRECTQSHTEKKQLETVICKLKHLTQEERINFLLSNSVGGEKCPLCSDVFSELKTHLDLCLQKHVGIPSVETIKEKLPADSEIKKDVNELKKVLQGMSEEEQKSYLYEKGNGSRCTLCDKSFKRLKTHLGSCIQKHFALDATDDSADTRSKDKGGTERQQEMLEETNNTKEDSEVETGAITDSQIGVRECTQSHTEKKQLETVICKLKHLTQEERINFLLSNSVGGEKCPLCSDVFSELKTHLDLCLQKHVGIPSVETIKEKLPADSEIKKDVNELKKVLQGMSEEEQKSYLYEKGNGSRCTLCDKSFKRLKTHLGSCIQKHFALDATDDSADTRSKDRGGTERQQEMLEETNNTKEDSEVETGAITDSQIGVRECTQSHTEKKQLETVICKLKHLTQEERINFLLSNSVGGEKCPLCSDVFSELKTHLDLCLQKHVGIPSVETIKEKLPADSEIKKDVNELKRVLQGMSEEEQKSYLYEKGNGSRCTLCDKSFKRLKTHLGSCIQKHFALDATDDSADTRSKDRGGTERQQEMLEETNNTKEDSEVETGAITDSQIGVRECTQSHTEKKQLETVICKLKHLTQEERINFLLSNSVGGEKCPLCSRCFL